MAQPFGVGDVVGGRYRITHHVVTSADQDIVFQASDEVLDRDVSILLASRSNAKQVATSARELAIGARDSDVQVLDLGLADERTYLISSLVDPNHLLDLVVPDSAPYVEPFFTDSLGSELFGQSRVMEPETFDDDDEYYAALHGDSDRPEDPARRFRRRRPAFLDKVSDSLNRRLNSENDAAALAVAAEQVDQVREEAATFLRHDMEILAADPAGDSDEAFSAHLEADPATSRDSVHPRETDLAAASASAAGSATLASSSVAEQSADENHDDPSPYGDEDVLPDGEEVVDNPPASPVDDFDAPPTAPSAAGESTQAVPARLRDALSFTGLIRPVPSLEEEAALQSPQPAAQHQGAPQQQAAHSLPADAASSHAPLGTRDDEDEAPDPDFRDEKPGPRRWLLAAALAAVLVVVAVVMFLSLRGGEVEDASAPAEEEQDAAEEQPGEEPAESEEASPSEEPSPSAETGPEPAIAGVTRVVPDSPELIADRDGQLPNLFDGDDSTSWVTLSFATEDFGGFSSNVALVAELEEPTTVSSVTLTQQGESSGGSFEVLTNDTASLDGAQEVGTGTLNWNETTVEFDSETEAAYVIINITELPTQESPDQAGLPYSVELSELSVD
ncbi:discoidin domain-containing protein [Nesterenkonia sp. Act20]|uniref:discoidin domain-containing protein n=1 Tax=Nesterenkonia sp. Act20 TaxID=1483432 RepID=UPI001C4754A5|nr:discoidin domain-containing protein [Nesterenkonia sp. Act20]